MEQKHTHEPLFEESVTIKKKSYESLLKQVSALTKRDEHHKEQIRVLAAKCDELTEQVEADKIHIDELKAIEIHLTEQVDMLKAYKEHSNNQSETIIEQHMDLSRLREERKELVEALREAMPIVKENISEYQRLMDVETFQEAAWALSQVKEQTEQTLTKIESLLSKFEVPNQS